MKENSMRNRPLATFLQIGKVLVAVLLAAILVRVAAVLLLSPRPPSFRNVPAVLTEAPCLAGICVGDEGQQRALERLTQHPLLLEVRTSGERAIDFGILEGGVGVLYFRQDATGAYEVVDEINVRPRGMPLDNALRALGPPQELFLMFGCGHGVHVHGKLFYPDEGIEVQVQFPSQMRDRTSPVALDEETPVYWIWYFDPEQYD